jgi:endonuclease/exonuclease/phosphatase family metal-dependent hydrolase
VAVGPTKGETVIRLGTFNLENLFTRPIAMNQESDAAGRGAIEDHATANSIVAKDLYSASDKAKLLELTAEYKWHLLDAPKNALVQLQKIRGQLFRKPQNGPVEVVANGRADWVGWFELRREDINWKATFNTGRVIEETHPDILIAIEVENRPTLERFNDQVLRAQFQFAYPHFLVIDGNDDRGIDVGIMSRFPIVEIRSHVDDPGPSGDQLFSRDCPEYDILIPTGERLVVIPNHLKSKRNGNDQASQDRRRAQAQRAHSIAGAALSRSSFVLIGGDLNDTPDSSTLVSLFTDGFQDVIAHPNYPTDRPGTYETGLPRHKLDYLIMSPQLRSKLTDTGIERRGSYHPNTWKPFDTVTKASEEASDHHLVWADFNF